MKIKEILSFLVLGAILVASAGISRAGGYMHHDFKSHEKSMGHSMETPFLGSETNESGDAGISAEFWGPVEAGTMPGTDESSGLQDTGVDPSRWNEPDAE